MRLVVADPPANDAPELLLSRVKLRSGILQIRAAQYHLTHHYRPRYIYILSPNEVPEPKHIAPLDVTVSTKSSRSCGDASTTSCVEIERAGTGEQVYDRRHFIPQSPLSNTKAKSSTSTTSCSAAAIAIMITPLFPHLARRTKTEYHHTACA